MTLRKEKKGLGTPSPEKLRSPSGLVFFALAVLILGGCSSLPKDQEPVTENFEAALQVYKLGESQYNQGLYEASLGSFESALYQYGVLDDRAGVISSFLAMGQSAVALGDYSRALLCYKWALPMAEVLDSPLLIRDTANHLGNCYLAMEDRVTAEEWVRYGPVLEEDTEVMAEYYRLRGTIAKRAGDYGQALQHYDRALSMDSSFPESLHIGTDYYLRASAYSLMGDYQKAEESLLRALEKDRFYEFLPGIAADLWALGLVLEKDGREEEALLYFQRAYLAWKGQGNEEKAEELSLRAARLRGEPLITP